MDCACGVRAQLTVVGPSSTMGVPGMEWRLPGPLFHFKGPRLFISVQPESLGDIQTVVAHGRDGDSQSVISYNVHAKTVIVLTAYYEQASPRPGTS